MFRISHSFAAAFLLAGIPASANAQVFGDLEGSGSYTWIGGEAQTSSEADRLSSVAGQARAGMVLGGGYVLQGDVFGEYTGTGMGGSFASGYGGALHLAWRNSKHAFGVFGGALEADYDDGSSDTSVRGFVGVEGQWFTSNRTFYLQGGWFGGRGGSEGDALTDAAFARGVVRHFFDPNTKLEAELSGAYGQVDGSDTRVIGWGLKLEKQFASHLSASIGYSGNDYYQYGDENHGVYDHVVRAGLKVHFSPGTLLSRDRTGAGFDTPSFLRWTGQTGGPLE